MTFQNRTVLESSRFSVFVGKFYHKSLKTQRNTKSKLNMKIILGGLLGVIISFMANSVIAQQKPNILWIN